MPAAFRVEALLKRRGLGPDADPEEADTLWRDDPGLAAIYSSSVRSRIAAGPNAGGLVARFGDYVDGDSLNALQSPRCATVSGYSIHANTSIGERDRMRVER